MATLTLQIVAGQTFTLTKTASAGDAARVLNALHAIYGAGPTDAQVFASYANDFFQGLINLVKGSETSAAVTTAAQGVLPIVLT